MYFRHTTILVCLAIARIKPILVVAGPSRYGSQLQIEASGLAEATKTRSFGSQRHPGVGRVKENRPTQGGRGKRFGEKKNATFFLK